jgi:hypothetical protein
MIGKVIGMGCPFLLLCAIGASAQDPPPGAAAQGNSATARVAPDIKLEALWDGRKIVPFKALDYPEMVKAQEADFLDDEEYVLGVTVGEESRAYPTRFAWWHHVINDKITDPKTGQTTAYAVTYCSVCNTGIRYHATLNGKTVMLDFYGLYNGVVTLCDRETESVFLQVSGKFVTGPLLGAQLRADALMDTTWGEWKRLHPDTLVMSPRNRFSRFYARRGSLEPRGYDRFPAPFFRPTVTHWDRRLPPFEKVLGVAIHLAGKEEPLRRAYPVKSLRDAGGALNETVEGVDVAVLMDPETVTANAFVRRVDGRLLTFEAKRSAEGRIAFYDRETATRWDITGRSEEGPLKGKRLTRIENHLSQWYGWVAYFPDTTIYGRTDPPQPAIGPEEDKPLPPNAPPTDGKPQS